MHAATCLKSTAPNIWNVLVGFRSAVIPVGNLYSNWVRYLNQSPANFQERSPRCGIVGKVLPARQTFGVKNHITCHRMICYLSSSVVCPEQGASSILETVTVPGTITAVRALRHVSSHLPSTGSLSRPSSEKQPRPRYPTGEGERERGRRAVMLCCRQVRSGRAYVGVRGQGSGVRGPGPGAGGVGWVTSCLGA